MAWNSCGLLMALLAVFSIIYTAEALRCYKCTSFELEMCGDYFNQTEIRRRMLYMNHAGDAQMPKEVDCGQELFPYSMSNQRAVCMKKVETEYGRKKYTRQCMFLNSGLTTLECPRESPTNRRTLDSCDVCETDLCNAAPSLHSITNLIALVPLLVAFYLRT